MRFKDMPKLPLVMIAGMFLIGVIVYPSLPDQIPTHWGPTGQIDAYAAKSFWSVFFAPLMALGLYLLLWFVPYLDPKRANVIRSKEVYNIVIELVTGLFTVIFIGTLFAANNPSFPMDKIISVGVGVLFIVLGNYMGRVKRNWTIGVRYPWTVSDDVVWAKTNRLGGRIFMVSGVLAIVGAFLPGMWGVALMLVPALAMLPITYFYSMNLYRQRHPDEMAYPEPQPEEPQGRGANDTTHSPSGS
jgi:uncharacterized membrane protein